MGTLTTDGNLSVKQLNIDGKRTIYQQGTSGEDTRANLIVIANLSSVNQNGMYINYGSLGSGNAHCRSFANSTTQQMHINALTGNVGIVREARASFRCCVNGRDNLAIRMMIQHTGNCK